LANRTGTEIVAGVTTFLTMSYIAIVNPAILSTEGTGFEFGAVMTATVIVAALSSIAMGVIARLPYGVAPGMGLNAYVTYSLILGDGLTGPEALGAVVLSGALFVLLSATPARRLVAEAMPVSLRRAAGAGIGLFLAFIGLKNAGVVVSNPATLVSPGPLTYELGLFALGLLIVALLSKREVRGALLIGIVVVTGLGFALGIVEPPAALVTRPDFSLAFSFEISSLWQVSLIAPIATLLLTDLFDSLSTLLGVAHAADLVDDDGQPVRLERALLADAIATLASGLLGSSPATTYVESASGIREGGRTGLTAIVTGLCFLPLLFFAPVAAAVPPFATAPVLVIVGVFMLSSVKDGLGDDLSEAVPAFLTLVLIPLSFSITQGLVWGVLSYLALQTLCGRIRSVPPALWFVGAACAAVLIP